jgi:hypothetical protein
MRVEKWDILMHRLLTEKKEKEEKASKSKGSKPDFLDLDKDGDTSEPMKKASKESGGKKETKSKKGKGKIPPQLKMHIKKKKSKLDEAIERLEKILFEQHDLQEYGEDKHPDIEDDDDFDDMSGYELDTDYDEDYDDEWSEEELEGDYDWQTVDNFADMDKDSDEEYEDEEDMEDDEELEEYLTEAEVKKKKPRLGKVTRNPSGSKKKFHVYVKCGGRVKKISFGDPGLSIKRDSPARRKNFRARHKCDKPAGKDRCTARYWSCYQWRAGKKVEGEE